MQLPEQLLSSLQEVKGFDKEAFEKVHASGEQVTSIRLNPNKTTNIEQQTSNIPWTQHGFYLTDRPSFTFDPLFHAGCYYVQEASSMFLEQCLKQTVDLSQPLKVLDLCAAPGGKSTHLQSLISKESLLVSNEVIKSRATILKDNIIKWGADNVVVTNNDPKDFTKLENYFDVIVIDAPCSGSGLFRREPEAMDEWSLNNVQLCSQRQQRILSDVLPALKKNGVLIYCTCSYSKEEDEEICQWILDEFKMESLKLRIEDDRNIIESSIGYRFWPDKTKGEGFFISCFRKKEGEDGSDLRNKNKFSLLSKKELAIVLEWIKQGSYNFIRQNEIVFAIPEKHFNDFYFLADKLYIKYFGVAIGEIIHEKLIPDHALAMSTIISDSIHRTELDQKTAIEYLQKKDLKLSTAQKDWQLVTFQDHPLGWINVLSNRINNYYPKNLRILKDN